MEDIYLVADVLGHFDIDTAKKHYSTIKKRLKRKGGFNYKAARAIILEMEKK